jgi:hypothetical protein
MPVLDITQLLVKWLTWSNRTSWSAAIGISWRLLIILYTTIPYQKDRGSEFEIFPLDFKENSVK